MRSFEQIMGNVIERVAAGIGMNELPPQEWAYMKLLKAGGLDPRSPFTPWLVKHAKRGNLVHNDENVDRLIQARAEGNPYESNHYFQKLTGGYWANPHANLAFPEPYQLDENNFVHDVEDFLPYLRKFHRHASKDPNYNLNAMNPKGVMNAYRQMMRDRAATYGKVVHTLPNGWTIRKLRNSEEAAHEGAAMANCIADYGNDIQNGDSHIFSLRDEKNRPKVSVEMNPTGPKQWKIEQMFEKANNSDIRPAFKECMKHWFANMMAKGHKIEGNDAVQINNVDELNKPAIDEYGLPAQKTLNSSGYYNSMLRPNGEWEYNPERIDQGLQGLLTLGDVWDRRRNLQQMGFLNEDHVDRLQELRQHVPQETWEAVRQSPYAQGVGHVQQFLAPYQQSNFTELRQPPQIQPDPAQHVFAGVAEHMNPYGEPCQCPWGTHSR